MSSNCVAFIQMYGADEVYVLPVQIGDHPPVKKLVTDNNKKVVNKTNPPLGKMLLRVCERKSISFAIQTEPFSIPNLGPISISCRNNPKNTHKSDSAINHPSPQNKSTRSVQNPPINGGTRAFVFALALQRRRSHSLRIRPRDRVS